MLAMISSAGFNLVAVVNFCYLLPTTVYIVKLVSFYDDRMLSKRAEASEMRKSLDEAYDAMLSEMNGLIEKAAESNALFAEQSFESKQRDFLRFLDRIKRLATSFQGTKAERQLLLQQVRAFCKHWLHVFEETSVDPIRNPRVVVLPHEIDECHDLRALVDLVATRVASIEAKVVLHRKDRHMSMINDVEATVRASRQARAPGDPATLEAPNMRVSLMETTEPPCLSWLRAGHADVVTGPDGYPRAYFLTIFTLVILSREHARLLLTVLLAPVIVFFNFEIMRGDDHGASALSWALVCYVVCLAVLLLNFERIDALMQLCADVQRLVDQKQKVSEMKEEMTAFWSTVQGQVDLWLYRTAPRLELIKEVHVMIEDSKPDNVGQMLDMTNGRLQKLEEQIGDVASWKNGKSSEEGKRVVGEAIRSASRGATSLRDMLSQVERTVAEVIPQALEAEAR
jgi:hypothetical protein